MSNTTVYLGVPNDVNLSQFTDVQRGIIFMWFVPVLVILIITGVRLVSGNLDPQGAAYEQGKQGKGTKPSQSSEQLGADKTVLKQQKVTQDDSGSVKMMKKITKFSTMLLPLSLTFALSFLLGASYAFSLVLYFLILLPLILFNVMEFHKWVFDHKVFICIFDNLWLISTIFWLINIWTINKYYQPYYLFQISPKA